MPRGICLKANLRPPFPGLSAGENSTGNPLKSVTEAGGGSNVRVLLLSQGSLPVSPSFLTIKQGARPFRFPTMISLAYTPLTLFYVCMYIARPSRAFSGASGPYCRTRLPYSILPWRKASQIGHTVAGTQA